MNFAGNLSRLRREAKLSQREAAEALGVSQALLSHYENGIREPKLEFVVRAANYYGATADWLLGRPGASRRKSEKQETGGGDFAAVEKFFKVLCGDGERLRENLSLTVCRMLIAAGGEKAFSSVGGSALWVLSDMIMKKNEHELLSAGMAADVSRAAGEHPELWNSVAAILKEAEARIKQESR
jgi:transcriptional regulator with XRE-family HTH domain